MNEPTYTIKEILDIQFANLNKELIAIKDTLREQNRNSDVQFSRLDGDFSDMKKEVAQLKEEHARYKLIIGIGATIGSSLIVWTMNKIF